MKNKYLLFSAGLAVLVANGPALAACSEELAAIGPALTTSDNNIAEDTAQSISMLYEQAIKACDDGDEANAMAAIANIKSLLGQ